MPLMQQNYQQLSIAMYRISLIMALFSYTSYLLKRNHLDDYFLMADNSPLEIQAVWWESYIYIF
jgi:hypothetical protein